MKIPLWAPMMGMARRSQVSERSGSMVARGASFRASTAMGTNSVPVSAGPVDAGRNSRVRLIGPRSGSAGTPPGPGATG